MSSSTTSASGVRWDVSSTITLRFGYEKHWLDLGEATSTPDFDQLKFGIVGALLSVRSS